VNDVDSAAACLRSGGVIAHATEGVWGLACDPHNDEAIERILAIKGRESAKGLLLIASATADFDAALQELAPKVRAQVMASWPGHVTWLLPGDAYSQFIKGQHSNVACRVPDHAQAREIAAAFGGPMVSTSLNRAGEPPVQDYERALAQFLELVDMVVPGQTSGYAGASAILDISGAVIRGASE